MREKRLLITGGAGYIGSHTVHHLLENGYRPEEIIVFDNLIYGHRKFVPKGVLFIKGDLLDKSTTKKIFLENRIEAVIHFAAYASVGESMTNPGKYFENNIFGGLNLLEAMVKEGCHKIVFSSTAAVYGIPEKSPISEDQPLKPINPYGESKLMFEKILEWYWKLHQIKSVRLRYFNAAGAAYGIGALHQTEVSLIPRVIETALGQHESIKIYGIDYPTPDGTGIRDYIHVADLASAHLAALRYLENKNVGTDSFNIGTGKGHSVRDIINLVKKLQPNFTVIETDRRPGDPPTAVADPTKANRLLGWQSQYAIEEVIGGAFNWHKSLKR